MFSFIDYSDVDASPLHPRTYQLPPWMQSQPALVQFLCPRCLPKLTEQRDQTRVRLIGDVQAKVQPSCERSTSAYGVCRGCAQMKVGDCHEMEPELRRATNVLWFLALRAIDLGITERSSDRERPLHPFETEDDVAENNELSEVQKAWERIRIYAGKLTTVRNNWRLDLARTAGMSLKEWETDHARRNAFLSARQVSRQHNLERYEKGYGPVGLARPTNVAADEALERSIFGVHGSASNQQKRFFYYGVEAPAGLASPVSSRMTSPMPRTPPNPRSKKPAALIDDDLGVLDEDIRAPSTGMGALAIASPTPSRVRSAKGKERTSGSLTPLGTLDFGTRSSPLQDQQVEEEEEQDYIEKPVKKTPKAKGPKDWSAEVGQREKSSRARKTPRKYSDE